ncbi:MAG: VCBS repeat-containing protein [Desulfobacteraceae bacterium]|nr:VCBS repeat-containing protein [Desulfobacteraceae bacterium]
MWTHLSSKNGEIPEPGPSTQQTAILILDVDKDGVKDFIIGSRVTGPSVLWFRRITDGWTRYVIDNTFLPIEAGGAYYDIDGDGDLDIVFGADIQSNEIWCWENPYPDYSPNTTWTRRLIKNSGSNKHHDGARLVDIDGDGDFDIISIGWSHNRVLLYENMSW